MKILRRVGFVLLSCMIFSPVASAAPFGYAADGDSSLPAPFYKIDLATYTVTQIGTVATRLEGLSFGPGGQVLYGVSDNFPEKLFIVSTSNAALTEIGPLNVNLSGAPGTPPAEINNPGMAFCPDNGKMYVSDTADDGRLFTVNLSTGQLTYIGQGVAGGESYNPSGLACSRTGVLYAASSTGDENDDSLYTINRSTGVATKVGLLGLDVSNPGLGDVGSRLLLVTDRNPGQPTNLYEVNRSTGAATFLAQLSASDLSFESFAVDVEAAGGPLEVPSIPTLSEWVMLMLAGLVGLFGFARLRRT